MNLKNNKGVTLVALTITIIVLLILSGIAIYGGSETIKNAKLESLKTNMLLIKAKAREYCEEASFKMGTNPTDETKKAANEYLNEKGTKESEIPTGFNIENSDNLYSLSVGNLKDMGINGVESNDENGKYYVNYNLDDVTVEIYNTKGFTKDGNTKYSLTGLQDL